MPLTDADHVAHQLEHRRVCRAEQPRHLLVGAIDRQRVLDQVVGSDREEVDLLGEGVGHQRCAGDLDHHPDGDLPAELDPLVLQVLHDVVEDHLGLAQLHQRADHGEHDADVALGAGAHDGAQLALEHGDVVQAHADRAVAQERVALGTGGLALGVLVRAQVEGAEDQRLALEPPQGFGGGLVVILLRRLTGLTGEVKELGAVEADALCAAIDGLVDALGDLDVGHERHLVPVERAPGHVEELGELGLDDDAPFLGLAVLDELFLVGVDDHDAVVAVDDDQVAGVDLAGDVSQPDDGGDTHGASDDGGVTGSPADVGGEALHVGAVQGRGLRGEQVVGDDHDVAAQVREVVMFLPDQVVEQAALDVVDVLDALGEVAVGDPEKRLRVTPHHDRDGELGGGLLLVDFGFDLLEERLVLEDADVDVEDGGDFLAGLGDHLLAQGSDLGDGGIDGLVEAGDLVGGSPGGDVAFGYEQILSVQHDGRADYYARGNAYALFDLHGNSILVASC